MEKEMIKNKIREMLPHLSNEELERHCARIKTLAKHVCLDDDRIVDMMDIDYLTLNEGLGGHAGLEDYRPEDKWWWYMDANTNAAINVRTGVIIYDDLIDIDFREGVMPNDYATEIRISEVGDDSFDATVVSRFESNPFINGALRAVKGHGDTPDDALEACLACLCQDLSAYYGQEVNPESIKYVCGVNNPGYTFPYMTNI